MQLSTHGSSMPSAVIVGSEDGSGYRVGETAVRMSAMHLESYEPNPKRLIAEGGTIIAGRRVSAEEVVGAVLAHVHRASLSHAGGAEPREVILTHPAAWGSLQVGRLTRAAERAGMRRERLRTVEEPIAAAHHYSDHAALPVGSRIAVFDFGGGTLDLALLEKQYASEYKVLDIEGDPLLGGNTFDARLYAHVKDWLRANGHQAALERLDTAAGARDRLNLMDALRSTKHELSTNPSSELPILLGDVDTVLTITAEEYVELIEPDLRRAVQYARDLLQRHQDRPLTRLYLTGGSSSTPAVARALAVATGLAPSRLDNPKLVVADGALMVPTPGASPQMPEPRHLPSAPRTVPANMQPPHPVPQTHWMPPPTPQQAGPQGQQSPPPSAVGPDRAPSPVTDERPRYQQAQRPGASERRPGAEAGSSGSGMADGRSAHPPRRRRWVVGLVIGVGAVLVLSILAVVVVMGALGRGPVPSDAASTPTPTPTPTEPELVLVACWDGSEVAAPATCPTFEGQEALYHAFQLGDSAGGDPASCASTATAVFGEQLAETIRRCTWPDLPGLSLYLSEYRSVGAAVSSWGEEIAGAEEFAWTVDGAEVGTSFTIEGADEEGRWWSEVVMYEDLPFVASYLAFEPDASRASIEAAWARVGILHPDDITEILSTTE
ncbi:MAG: Hsp70 family protein [Actinomycetota bacterium]